MSEVPDMTSFRRICSRRPARSRTDRECACRRRDARTDRRRPRPARCDCRPRSASASSIAAGQVYNPDTAARRRMVKATHPRSARRAASTRDEKRARRDRHPDAAPAARLHHAERLPAGRRSSSARSTTTRSLREAVEPQHCYVCKQDYSTVHHFYDQLCPACAEFNFAKRTELADLRGRVALLTGGRVKIGYQAGLKLLRAGARLIVTTRFPRDSAARYAAEPDFAEWGASARDLRARPAPHAERRGVLPRAARHARPARLHHQQRLPDGAPSAGVLRAHDGGRDRGAARHAGARAPAARRLRGPARLSPAPGGRRGRRRARSSGGCRSSRG